jgi:plasmid stabilization system protein ParE
MADRKHINIPSNQPKLVLTKRFKARLQEVLKYSLETWGGKVSVEFYFEIIKRVQMLPHFPKINPKNRFLESTNTKEYRNIIFNKYSYIVTYSVTKSVIRVINIIHASQNPDIRTQKQ